LQVSEDAAPGTLVHQLLASDPDVEDPNGLEYSIVEPISAVDSSGKPVTDSNAVAVIYLFLFIFLKLTLYYFLGFL